MNQFLLVCLGGAIGSGARYLVAVEAPRLFGTAFPYGTLIANTAGSFLLGAIMYVGVATTAISPELRLMLTTGVMGGFTTYSTFNYETIEYLRTSSYWLAGANVVVTLVACLLAGALGVLTGRLVVGN
jgi:CrcB protein